MHKKEGGLLEGSQGPVPPSRRAGSGGSVLVPTKLSCLGKRELETRGVPVPVSSVCMRLLSDVLLLCAGAIRPAVETEKMGRPIADVPHTGS